MFRLTFLASDWSRLEQHLNESSPEEDGAFFLIHRGKGSEDTRLLATKLLFPPDNGWESKGNHRLRPTGQWLSGVIGSAIEDSSGIGFVHSHPHAFHPASLSPIDRETSLEWARTILPTTGGPFISIVVANGKVAGWVFESDASEPCDIDRITVVGEGSIRSVGQSEQPLSADTLDDRQIRALGELNNANLRELTVGLVGAGGTGSPVGEQLARMGVAKINIFDPDKLDTPSNLRRVVGSRPDDVKHRRHKAVVLQDHLNSLKLGSVARAFPQDAREETAARVLLDSDVVISTTDTQSSRAFLNQLAYQYWLPVIDVGVRVGMTLDRRISGMPVETRLLLAEDGCLWCRDTLNSDLIREENLPIGERAALAREGYVQGVQESQPSLTPLNFLASSIATLSMLRAFGGRSSPSTSFIVDVWESYVHPLPNGRRTSCICNSWRGKGDDVYLPFKPPEKGAT